MQEFRIDEKKQTVQIIVVPDDADDIDEIKEAGLTEYKFKAQLQWSLNFERKLIQALTTEKTDTIDTGETN